MKENYYRIIRDLSFLVLKILRGWLPELQRSINDNVCVENVHVRKKKLEDFFLGVQEV